MRKIAQSNFVDQGIAVPKDLGFGDIMLEAGGDLSTAVDRRDGQVRRVGLQLLIEPYNSDFITVLMRRGPS